MEKRTVEIQAKTVDQAIMDALAELGAGYDDVEVEILSQGGFMRKAKVRVTLKASVGEKKETKKEELKEKKEEPKKEYKEIKKDDKEQNKEQKKEYKEEKKDQKKSKDEHEKESKKEHEKEQKKEKSVKLADGELPVKFARTLEFTKKMMEYLENGCEAEGEVTEKSFNINLVGGNIGQVIGRGGEVLNAIQTLVSAIAIINSNGEHKRVYVNAEDYKERRKETLVALALKKAEKVKTTGRYIKLEPMNSRDRAIVHSALQEIEGVRTYSTGKDPFRCLCIAPKKDGE